MTRRRLLLLVLVGLPLTVVAYGVLLGITAFMACGISGCSGGGFGPAYGPVEAQLGILVAGLTVVPLTLLSLSGRPRAVRLGTAAVLAASAAFTAMAVLGLSVNGCPQGLDRVSGGAGTTCDDGRGS